MRLGLLLGLLCFVKGNTFSENDIPELVYMDTTVDPCDNFYQFACGNFKNVHPRPLTDYIVDHFTLLEQDLIKIGNEILATPKQKDDPVALKKAKSAYMGCVNDYYLNSVPIPELQTVGEVGGLPIISSSNDNVEFSWNEIGDLVGKYGVPLIFVYSIAQTSQNESLIILNPDTLTNPALFRPNHYKSYENVLEEDLKEMARGRSPRSTPQPAAFDVFLQTLAKNLLRYTNPNKTDDEVLEELDDMANFMRSMYASGIIDKAILPLEEFPPTLEQLQNWTNSQFGAEVINWLDYLGKIFQFAGVDVTPSTKLYHQGLDKLYGVLNLVLQTDPGVVKNFALFRIFLFQAPDSDHATRKAFEDYYTAKMYKQYPRWEYCTRKILDVVDTAGLSFAVTYAYERYHYNINKIPQAAEMIGNIRNAFEEKLATSDWMDAESRDAALRKVKNILVLLAYPDFVSNKTKLDEFYDNFRICQWDNYGNARNIRAFKQAYQFTQLAPEREFWGKSTFDPNAYYNRPNNKIVIPIAMLNPVFFYGDNPIIDYSRLGSIVGHEITHGFDQNGKNYNEDGMPIGWWTNQTMENFLERTQCFIKQYSDYYVSEIDTYVNGSYCINENLADNGGVREAFKAFRKVQTEQNIQVSGNYTAEQLFFIGYGTMWCSDESDYYLNVLTTSTNSYPPNRFRVIGSLSNMAEFSDAFNCPVGSGMNPESKCLLW